MKRTVRLSLGMSFIMLALVLIAPQEEKDIPMRPAALTNMPLIDEGLGTWQ